MKFFLQLILIVLVSWIAQRFLPWWGFAPLVFLVALTLSKKGGQAFLSGFLGLALLWGGYAFCYSSMNDGIMANRMGQVLGGLPGGGMILITIFLGGLLGGLSAWSGQLARKLFQD